MTIDIVIHIKDKVKHNLLKSDKLNKKPRTALLKKARYQIIILLMTINHNFSQYKRSEMSAQDCQ